MMPFTTDQGLAPTIPTQKKKKYIQLEMKIAIYQNTTVKLFRQDQVRSNKVSKSNQIR